MATQEGYSRNRGEYYSHKRSNTCERTKPTGWYDEVKNACHVIATCAKCFAVATFIFALLAIIFLK